MAFIMCNLLKSVIMRRQEAKSYLHSSRHARPDRASLAFAILFTGISPSLLTAESFLFNDARKSSNCPMCKCVFVLICKYTNALMCVCVYVLMCSTKLSKALSLSKFYRFLDRKRSEITPFFKTSKQIFQPRFHLSVSPDCKMCVRVTNTGKSI